MKKRVPLFIAVLSLTVAYCSQTEESLPEVAPLTDDYILRQWGVGDGVPEAIVMHVTQSPDGFLWVTTPTRIAQFDGQRFISLTPQELPPQLPTLLRGVHFDVHGGF
jgi:hypothetical protein